MNKGKMQVAHMHIRKPPRDFSMVLPNGRNETDTFIRRTPPIPSITFKICIKILRQEVPKRINLFSIYAPAANPIVVQDNMIVSDTSSNVDIHQCTISSE